MKTSSYQMGWIGIRASKMGKASVVLKADGWVKMDHGDLNNRNAWDWVRPVSTKLDFTGMDWSKLANAGLVARPLGSAMLRAEVERAEERLRNDPCTQSRRALSEASAAWRKAIWDDNHINQSND